MREYRGIKICKMPVWGTPNKWIYGDKVEIGKRCWIVKNPECIESDDMTDLCCTIYGFYEVIPESVGQYLRKDKNGVDIYSNMPIRYCDTDYPNGFVWDESGVRWTLNDGYYHTHYGKTGTGGEDDYLDLEVIGNKTDNPKLLE